MPAFWTATSPAEALETPHRTTVYVLERSIDLAIAAQELPAWMRWVIDADSVAEARQEAEQAYGETLAAELEVPGDDPAELVVQHRDALHQPRVIEPGLRARVWSYAGVTVLLLGGGLAVLIVWLLRRAGWPALGRAAIPPPWNIARGFGVVVRAGALSVVALFALVWVAPDALAWSSLVCLLAFGWMTRRYLLTDGAFQRVLGLEPPPDLSSAMWTAAAVFALALAGEMFLVWVAELAGYHDYWTDLVFEPVIMGSPVDAILNGVDAVVWAPLLEELAFRGLVYGTLRSRFGFLPAAIASSLLFAAMHLYSLPGFLAVAWSGFLWAAVYERTRSLWPPIACHALFNLFAFSGLALLYR